MNAVVIVDYGLGNLLSVTRALEEVGAQPILSSDPTTIRQADRLVLPGVGAFGDGMAGLRARNLLDPIRDFAHRERPFLGICLGMQLMMDEGEEFGRHQGLGLIPGRTTAIPTTSPDGSPLRIPHIGWNALRPIGNGWDRSVLGDITPGATAYFVHSFRVEPIDPINRVADCDYGGVPIIATVQRGALTGCQFHPEKSGPTGLTILKRFLTL